MFRVFAVVVMMFVAILVNANENMMQKGEVTADTVNVRVRPSGSSTVVTRVKRGEILSVYKTEGVWCEIAIPDSAAVYVASQFIRNGKTYREVNLRSGPGIEFQSYGTLESDQEVKVVDSSNNLWLKIAPPEKLRAYISKDYVKLIPIVAPAAPENKITSPVENGPAVPPPPEKVEEKVPTEKLLSAQERADLFRNMIFIEGSERNVSLRGRIFALADKNLAVTHALVDDRGVTKVTLGFLYSPENDLNMYLDKMVTLDGTERLCLVPAWKTPVILVRNVNELKAAE